MSFRNYETNEVIAQRETARAKERARMAAKPTHNWLVTDRYRMEAAAPDAPAPTPEKPKRGRPPKVRPEAGR